MPIMEQSVPAIPRLQCKIRSKRKGGVCLLVHLLRPVENPIPASTHIAQVLKP